VYCSKLSFHRSFHHVKAHQDDNMHWETLGQAAAKQRIYEYQHPAQNPKQFPLEPVTLSVNEQKLTSDTGSLLWYFLHKHKAEILFQQQGVLSSTQFYGGCLETGLWHLKHIPKNVSNVRHEANFQRFCSPVQPLQTKTVC
jgi:hypothetical protein